MELNCLSDSMIFAYRVGSVHRFQFQNFVHVQIQFCSMVIINEWTKLMLSLWIVFYPSRLWVMENINCNRALMANLNISCKNVIESRLSSTLPITNLWCYDACSRPRYVNSNKLFHFWVNTFFIDQQRTSSLTHSSTLTAPGGPALQPAPATPPVSAPVSIGGAGPGWPPPASAEDRSVYKLRI